MTVSALNRFRPLLLLPFALMLGACNFVVLDPAGDVAGRQRDLLIVSVVLMLIIIVPVMVLIALFAWRYRAGNRAARYEPDWDHSTHLELVIWAAPLLIIICLGALTWMGTHLLDPYRPLDRISAGRPVARTAEPLLVEAVALDWKWLFIYPEYGIATVNEMAAPVDRPIRFRLTATSVMNSFYVPALAGQIYTMPGMETVLHGVINRPGRYVGFSANYSGAGFSGMRFTFHGLSPNGFDAWIAGVKAEGGALDRAAYLQLARRSENDPVRHYAVVEPQLFRLIRDRCVEPGTMCMDEMMAIDARGGLGLAGLNLLPTSRSASHTARSALFGTKATTLSSICTIEEAAAAAAASRPIPIGPQVDPAPLHGAGLPRPGFSPMPPPGMAGRLLTSLSSGS